MISIARNAAKENARLAREILETYQPKSVSEMQAALKDIFDPMFEVMLQGELDAYLGYESNECREKSTMDRRNSYSKKTLKTTAGNVEVSVPRDWDGSFTPRLVEKRPWDVSAIEGKVLAMYGKGMSQRDIQDTIQDIYGFDIFHEAISSITDRVLEELEEGQNWPLKKLYTFLFVDRLYIT